MAATAHPGVDSGEILPTRHRTAGLPNRLGQGNKIIYAMRRRVELALVPDKIPTTRCGEAAGVLFAEVVRMRLGERGERTDDGGRVGVHVGQRRDGKPGAAVAGATPWRPHRRTLSPRATDRLLRHAAIRGDRPEPARRAHHGMACQHRSGRRPAAIGSLREQPRPRPTAPRFAVASRPAGSARARPARAADALARSALQIVSTAPPTALGRIRVAITASTRTPTAATRSAPRPPTPTTGQLA